MSHFFAKGSQSIGVSASASVLPMNIQDWFPLGLTGLIFLQSKGLSRVFCSTTIWKHHFFGIQASLWFNSQHLYMTTGKTVALTRQTFVGKVMFLLFNTLSRFGIAFLPGASIAFNYMAAVTICSDFGAQENKVCHCFHFFPYLFAMKWWVWMPWSYFFKCWVLSQLFHCPLSP